MEIDKRERVMGKTKILIIGAGDGGVL